MYGVNRAIGVRGLIIAQKKKQSALAGHLARRVKRKRFDPAVVCRNQLLIRNETQNVTVLIRSTNQQIIAATLLEPRLGKLKRRLEREAELRNRQCRPLYVQR